MCMQISWKGQACFYLAASRGKQEQVRILIDPFQDSIGLHMSSVEADLLLITHEHHDHNNRNALKGIPPFSIANPGEYEVKEVFVEGISSFHDASDGKERGLNAIYTIEAEGMKLCHLGDLGQKELTSEQLEQIGNIDILFIPVGGVYTIDGQGARNIINQIEPKIVIPMHYRLPKLKVQLEGIEDFLKVMGKKEVEPQLKLVLKAKDLPAEEMQIILLQPS